MNLNLHNCNANTTAYHLINMKYQKALNPFNAIIFNSNCFHIHRVVKVICNIYQTTFFNEHVQMQVGYVRG